MASTGRGFRRSGGFPNPPLPPRILRVMDVPRETLPSLPDDAEALRALVLAALAERDTVASERDAAVTERDTLLAQNDRLRHLLLKLTRMHFGARSERLPEEQLQLGLEALEQAIANLLTLFPQPILRGRFCGNWPTGRAQPWRATACSSRRG